MKLQVYAVRDRATDQYSNPVFLVSNSHAIRVFSDEVNSTREGNNFHFHADDYELYNLGVFDSDTGLFDTGVPKSVILLKDLLVSK